MDLIGGSPAVWFYITVGHFCKVFNYKKNWNYKYHLSHPIEYPELEINNKNYQNFIIKNLSFFIYPSIYFCLGLDSILFF